MLNLDQTDFKLNQKPTISEAKKLAENGLKDYQKVYYIYWWIDENTFDGSTLLYKGNKPILSVPTRFHVSWEIDEQTFNKYYRSQRLYLYDDEPYKLEAGIHTKAFNLGKLEVYTTQLLNKLDYKNEKALESWENYYAGQDFMLE